MAETRSNMSGLRRMSDADYEVAPNEPDVRGWKVVLANDEVVGEVDDLIIDPSAEKVRYLDVDLDTRTLNLERDRHVFIPIRNAHLDTSERHIVLDGMTRDALLKTPEYDESRAAGYDTSFQSQLSDDARSPRRLTRSAEEVHIGKRRVPAGDVEVGKHVETERVREPVTRRREEVDIERRPVRGSDAYGSAHIGEDKVRIPVSEEEVTVEKRPVVKEEIVVSKRDVEQRDTVEADVRKERIDVERTGRSHVRDRDRNR